ncbi:MAG: GntR family transcriptional regulator [Pseudomonadota bacterium]
MSESSKLRRAAGRRPAPPPDIGRLPPGDPDNLERQVYALLQRSLMTGAVQMDAVLSTRTIANRLGISPMPVRSALKRLEAENILIAHARSGYRVAPIEAEEYLEILQIRARLEGMAATLAARRITPEQLDRLRRWNRTLAKERLSPRRFLGCNHGFHFEMYRAARSPILYHNISAYWLRIGPVLYASLTEYDQHKVVRTHDALISALAAGDPQKAEETLRADLFSASGAVIDMLTGSASSNSAISY